MLLSTKTILHDIWLEIPVYVADVDRKADDTADFNTRKDDTELSEIEAVFVDICEWKGFEE